MTHIDKTKFGPWAIVTGASSGIGQEFARQVAASGLNVVLVARRASLLETVGEEIAQEFGVDYRTIAVDLTGDGFLAKIEAATHDLDIGLLISNAGTGVPGEFLHINPDVLLHIVHLNVVTHLLLTHHYGQKMARRGRGGIVLVSAMGATAGIPYMANDAATKAYITSLGQGLHAEFQKSGVNMTVVLPGPTKTPILDAFGFDTASMPLKPMPVAQCVAEGLAALNANRATHLTGRLNRLITALVPSAITRKVNGRMIARGLAGGPPRAAHLNQ